jgi:hypothetical protein
MNTRLLFLLGISLACSPFRDNEQFRLKQGATCAEIGDCQTGLVCAQNGTCQPIGTLGTQIADQNCQADEECAIGLVCDAQGVCGLDVPTKTGDPCSLADGCASGLICGSGGQCVTEGSPGTGLEGDACDAAEDCAFGYGCDQWSICSAFPKWNGVDCTNELSTDDPNITFSLSGNNSQRSDFFKLPFPNSIRVNSGHVDYSDFPGLDSVGAPGETLSKYTNLLSASQQGFSPNATITTRFSYPVQFQTLKFGGNSANFRFVDLTVGDPGYGLSPRSRFFATGGRDKYTCQNYLSIRPSEGTPLREGHTYAAVFFKGLKTTDGRDFVTARDLVPLLQSAPPESANYAPAWVRYQPLRQWLRDEELARDDVIGATVFTVGQPTQVLKTLKTAAQQAPPVELGAVVDCQGASTSNRCSQSSLCDNNLNATAFTASLSMPLFLSGDYPYAGANSLFTVNGNGVPLSLESVQRCAAVFMSEVDGGGPDQAKPVALFIPDGTSGTKDFVNSALAQTFIDQGYALVVLETPLNPLSDQEETSTGLSPEMLPHDLTDPIRARNLYLQGIMELFAFERLLVENENIRAALSFAAVPLVIGAHGLGVNLAVPFSTHSDHSRALVLGAGEGGVIDSYLYMKQPLDVSTQLPFLLADEELNGIHPGMSLIQSWLDPRDPMNYGALVRANTDAQFPKHLFYVYGTDNSVVSQRAQNALVTSMRLKLVGEMIEPLTAVASWGANENELRNNIARTATQGMKQYYPNENSDGHDVLLNSDAAVEDIGNFIRALNEGDGVPTLQP